MDAWMDGDVALAKRLLRERLTSDGDDREALGLLNEIELSESFADEGFGADEAEVAFCCLGCGNTGHEERFLLLNSRGLTVMGWDALNRSADCLVCQTCGLVHWFVQAAPGAYQALHPALRGNSGVPGDARPGGCLVCGFDTGYARSQLVNTRGLSLLGLDFLNTEQHALVCQRCGFMHWHDRDVDDWALPGRDHRAPDPPLGRGAAAQTRGRCLACGGHKMGTRRALLNSRGMTFFGLDWADEGATLAACQDCGYVSWYAGGSG